mmetsp:Transcript_24327/g.57644  ORF Transcript_24327/g.57644 Transcript_24327/m.57644 type:complete len:120 (-) Transcript_24327:2105-2464(-)
MAAAGRSMNTTNKEKDRTTKQLSCQCSEVQCSSILRGQHQFSSILQDQIRCNTAATTGTTLCTTTRQQTNRINNTTTSTSVHGCRYPLFAVCILLLHAHSIRPYVLSKQAIAHPPHIIL